MATNEKQAVNEQRLELFDRWAADYDVSVYADGDDGFPFAGYEKVLDTIAQIATNDTCNGEGSRHILDVGIGTGNLAEKLVGADRTVYGVDFSEGMLSEAAERVPDVHLVRADLLQPLPPKLAIPFDAIVSAYVLHEFDLPTKLQIVQALAAKSLAPGGVIVIGDVAFPSGEVRRAAHERWRDVWDEEEYYWAADEAIAEFEKLGWAARYTQVSVCAGVFEITPTD